MRSPMGTMERRLSELLSHEPAALNEADSGQPMDDRTAIDVYERDKYSEDHPEHRDGDGNAPQGSPIEHDATLTDRCERAVLFVAVATPAASGVRGTVSLLLVPRDPITDVTPGGRQHVAATRQTCLTLSRRRR